MDDASRRPESPAQGIVWVPPTMVRFSQSTIGSTTRLDGKEITLDELVETFRRDGYVSEPIQVVTMPDGQLTSLDNRRLWAAQQAGLTGIAAVAHEPNDPCNLPRKQRAFLIPIDPIIDTEGVFGMPGSIVGRPHEAPRTMADAIVFRCNRQRTIGLDANYPLQGSTEMPRVTQPRPVEAVQQRPAPPDRSTTAARAERDSALARRALARLKRSQQRGFGK